MKLLSLLAAAAMAVVAMAVSVSAIIAMFVWLTYANSGETDGVLWGMAFLVSTLVSMASWRAVVRRLKVAYIRAIRSSRSASAAVHC